MRSSKSVARSALRVAGALLALVAIAHAEPHVLTDLAVPAGDDARNAIAIGPRGEVYDPDGKGAWTRARAITVADDVAVTGRANGVVALANGAVYRLAENGWSALRIVQKGKAVMSSGARSVAAVGRQLFALDKLAGGEVAKLAMAPQPVQMIGAGTKALTIQTERGVFRNEGAGWKAVARAPRRVERLIDDTWALTEQGPIDLKTGKVTPWPEGFRLGAVTPGAKNTLVIVGTSHGGAIEVVVIGGAKVSREAIAVTAEDATPLADPVGVVTDTSGRAVVAFRDGRMAIRERGAWSVTAVVEALPSPRPGAPPARSP